MASHSPDLIQRLVIKGILSEGPQRKEKLDKVNALPRENKRENFLGLIMSMGRRETASPKQIMPKIRLVMNPIIRCFLLKLGSHSSAFLPNQL